MFNRIFLGLAIAISLALIVLFVLYPPGLVAWILSVGTMLLLVCSFLPGKTRISRSITVSAPASEVFRPINELKMWGQNDPSMSLAYEGPPAGVGTSCCWGGDQRIGEGRVTVIESQTNELVRLKLEHRKPMPGTTESEFTFRETNGSTVVIWSWILDGSPTLKLPFFVFFLERRIGRQIENGLVKLKSGVETPAP